MVVGYFNVGSGVFKMDSNGRSAKKEKYLEKDSEKKNQYLHANAIKQLPEPYSTVAHKKRYSIVNDTLN
jgi:hypothetical protein